MGFNKAQNEAIMHGKGPCQVLAGPGSGKTLTIVNRIKYLIERYEVRPEEILVVTFTRFAAAEMKSRLCSLMGKSNVPVTAGTFHGIYYGILKWAYRLGPDNILSEEEKYRILRRVSEDCGTEAAEEEDFLHDIAEEIGLVKNNGLKIGQFVSKKCRQDTFRELYEKYEAQRKAVRKLDFDDMLVLCKDLFVSHPDVLKQWQTKFKYILVDEFQDINRVQYDVIRMLALGNIERNDLLQVMNRPKRYIGRDSVASGKPSFEEMRKFYCDKEWMLDRIDQFEWDVKMLRKTAPYAGINYIRKRIGYDDFLKDYAFTRKIDRANLNEVLAELEEAARPFATIEEWFRHIEEYTRLLRLKSMKRQEDREGVRLMTLHSAKGLEFDTVFLVEANEGKMPYKKAKTDAETEEERRLFYVGMTRAKEVLKVSYVKTKNGKETSPSRFVDELLE